MASPSHVVPFSVALIFSFSAAAHLETFSGGTLLGWYALQDDSACASQIHPLVLEILRAGRPEDMHNHLDFILLTTFKSHEEKEEASVALRASGIDIGKLDKNVPFTVILSFPPVSRAPPGNSFAHPTIWEFVGGKRYLQMAVSKALAGAYAEKFGAVTSQHLLEKTAREGQSSFMDWVRDVGCRWNEIVGPAGGTLFIHRLRG